MNVGLSRRVFSWFLVINVAWTAGCTSLHTVEVGNSSSGIPPVIVGQVVRVTTKEGQKQEFKVTRVEPDALVGVNAHVRYEEIGTLEVRAHDPGKTAIAITVAVIGGILLAVALAQAVSDAAAASLAAEI